MKAQQIDPAISEALGLEPSDPCHFVEPSAYVQLFAGIRYIKARRWLSVYAQGFGINETARITGYDSRLHYYWKDMVPGYVEAFEKATEIRADHAEDEIYRRGIMGYLEELHYKGQKTGQKIRKYSDVLAIVAAKALRPHKYRENLQANQTVNVPISVTIVMPHELTQIPAIDVTSDKQHYDVSQSVNLPEKKD